MRPTSTTIRIPAEMRETLRGLAEERHSTLQGVLVEALELYRRERFVQSVNAGYAALREQPAAWDTDRAERDIWDSTVGDGLRSRPSRPRRKKS